MLRWLSIALVISACNEPKRAEPTIGSGSGSATPPELVAWSEPWLLQQGERFIADTPYRRAALETSLVNHTNTYSRQRLGAYALGDRGWDGLPAWNPRSVPVTAELAAALERGEMPAAPTRALWDGTTPTTMAAWIALGRRVFFEYPMRSEVFMEWGLMRPAVVESVGVERTPDGAVPGLVVFANVDGNTRVGITCAICHTAVRDGELVTGAARRRFDYGALRLAYFADTKAPVEPILAERMATWGPGRADVTEDNDADPVAIPDLWGLRHESALTQAGTINHSSPLALAIRQDTQLIHANHQRVRAPRELAWALAMFLYSLEPPTRRTPTIGTNPLPLVAGAAIFDASCRGCHSNSALGGAPLAAAAVGTDPALANGQARGTGKYRPAPLLDVANAAPYLHHGAVSTLVELLSPARLDPAYRGGRLGPGAIPGHRFGTELTDDDRRSLIAYLETL